MWMRIGRSSRTGESRGIHANDAIYKKIFRESVIDGVNSNAPVIIFRCSTTTGTTLVFLLFRFSPEHRFVLTIIQTVDKIFAICRGSLGIGYPTTLPVRSERFFHLCCRIWYTCIGVLIIVILFNNVQTSFD